ncbi:MAG: prenyltransferase/squalene oxidase repeat-containing protein [Candidatus Bilamarchaeaceae archaeon]
MDFGSFINTKKLIDFIKCRLNSDGGYSFSYPIYGVEFPSSISETFYALAIFSMLDEDIPSKNKTIAYLENIQRIDGNYDSPSVAFYAVKSLKLLGRMPKNAKFVDRLYAVLKRFRIFKEHFGGEFFSADYDVAGSPYRLAYQAAKTLHLVGLKIEEKDVSWILPENKNGGFGEGRSDTVSTYHALTALRCGNYELTKLRETPSFIKRCATEQGGYSMMSGCLPPYVETTYFSIASLNLLGKKPEGAEKHIEFLVSLQNEDGGFRRSFHSGISTLCNSYFALKALMVLSGDADAL